MKALTCGLLVLSLSVGFWGCSKSGSGGANLKNRIDFTDPSSVRNSGSFGVYEDGWVGTDIEVLIGNSSHQPVLEIQGTNVQTKPGDEVLPLCIQVGLDTVDAQTIQSLGDFRALVILPQKLRALDTLEVRITTSKSFVPKHLGTSQDDRQLWYRLHHIALVSLDTTKAALPSSFEFPRSQEVEPNVQGIYSDGWMADSATVTLFNQNRSSFFEIKGSVPGNVYTGPVSIDVYCGGALLLKQQIQGNFRVRMPLPEKLRDRSRLIFTLKPVRAFMPAERGINNDRRRLSYRILSVGLR